LAISNQLEALQGITSWRSSCFVHLYLADMAHFGVANAAYCRHLPQVDPPSRACVQVSARSVHPALTVTGVQEQREPYA
jgi:enamine deaminase RidA (YjgF/YER057c/UK114 family)